jgi:hypothetical protein
MAKAAARVGLTVPRIIVELGGDDALASGLRRNAATAFRHF